MIDGVHISTKKAETLSALCELPEKRDTAEVSFGSDPKTRSRKDPAVRVSLSSSSLVKEPDLAIPVEGLSPQPTTHRQNHLSRLNGRSAIMRCPEMPHRLAGPGSGAAPPCVSGDVPTLSRRRNPCGRFFFEKRFRGPFRAVSARFPLMAFRRPSKRAAVQHDWAFHHRPVSARRWPLLPRGLQTAPRWKHAERSRRPAQAAQCSPRWWPPPPSWLERCKRDFGTARRLRAEHTVDRVVPTDRRLTLRLITGRRRPGRLPPWRVDKENPPHEGGG